MENLHINHRFIAHEEDIILDDMGDFNKLLVQEFYNKIPMNNNLDSFTKVEHALHKFLRHYNFSRVISSGCNAGKVPAKVILERAIHNNVDLDTLPLWILALIDLIKRGEQND